MTFYLLGTRILVPGHQTLVPPRLLTVDCLAYFVFSTAGALSRLGFSARSIQSIRPVHPSVHPLISAINSFLTVQGSSGQFQTVPTQLNSAQLSSAQLSSTQLNSTQLNSTQLNSTQLNSTQLSSAQLSSAQLSSAQLSSAQLS